MVYAADWRYQLVQKLVRAEMLSEGPVREAQVSDIVYLARAIMEREGKGEIRKDAVRSWYKYTKNIRDQTFDEVNESFQEFFGVFAFV
ncbi:hypothetical protein FRC08_009205 [Ceratobasidium sp. 394]|nr:hypothetical protein FRC08_009205 [Ceratobasidium sp. 394]